MNISLYVHIPFCQKKCRYCDFYSIERTHQMDEFTNMLIRELELRAQTITKQHLVPTVFFGGGTPSLLSTKQFQRIAETIRKNYNVPESVEWTMECNPGTITLENLKSYKQNGVNRLSLGVQSFHQNELDFLDRIHSPSDAKAAVDIAREAGFTNINIDLMFALPHQTFQSFSQTLQQAIELKTEHVSAYSLIYEEGTPLFAMLQKGEVSPSSEETDAEMYELAINTLQSAGYEQYEISNFAKPGYECKHNLVYWQSEQYLSFGPSAHGFIDNSRYWNYRNISTFIQKLSAHELPTANTEVLSVSQQMFERAFLELRSQGIELQKFADDFGINLPEVLGNNLEIWQQEKLVTTGSRLQLTSTGYLVCDELTLKVITALEKHTNTVWPTSTESVSENLFTIL